jgi:hypothetical protein
MGQSLNFAQNLLLATTSGNPSKAAQVHICLNYQPFDLLWGWRPNGELIESQVDQKQIDWAIRETLWLHQHPPLMGHPSSKLRHFSLSKQGSLSFLISWLTCEIGTKMH